MSVDATVTTPSAEMENWSVALSDQVMLPPLLSVAWKSVTTVPS